MTTDDNPLCCCEYIDIHQQRNHILGICCNCYDLDESFESFITGKTINSAHVQGMMTTFQDRTRIPWYGGARQIPPDVLLPILMLPITLLVAAISVWWTIITFTLMLLLLSYLYCYVPSLQKTKFFLSWTLTSFVIQSLIFEFIVVPFLEILIHENVILTIIVCACMTCIYIVKLRSTRMNYIIGNEMEIGECGKVGNGRSHYCPICQISVPERDHHCVWFDCCIGYHNRFLFLVSIILGIIALLYSSNLTLTSVCHPFHLYKTILLPDDCSDVYEQFELSLAFISAIYSIGVASIFGILLMYEVLLISIGLTGQEWRALPISSKLCCAITVNRPYDKGFVLNWFRICNKNQKTTYQY